jgi:hypothetical protein
MFFLRPGGALHLYMALRLFNLHLRCALLQFLIHLANVELPNVELPNIELLNIELPNAELPNVESPNAENYPTSNITQRRILPNVEYYKTYCSIFTERVVEYYRT